MYYYIKLRRWFKNNINLHKLKRYYKSSYPESVNSDSIIVYMCDGHKHHGGLGDRLSGLVSTYAYCKEYGKEFKVNWTFPYPLTDFLLPNKYNWIPKPNQISYNPKSATPVLISFKESLRIQQKYAQRVLGKPKAKQIHVYTNMKYTYPQNFKFLFDELFKAAPCLQQAIEKEQKHLPEDYISITFRFQQLLGDLEEGNFPTIDSLEKREILIKRCLEYVRAIYKRNGKPQKILVTSDSATFLKRVAELPYVHVIKGELVHVDFNTKEVDKTVHMKSFLDLYMIANAKTIYSVIEPPLFRTGFPWFASLVSGHQFIEISNLKEYGN